MGIVKHILGGIHIKDKSIVNRGIGIVHRLKLMPEDNHVDNTLLRDIPPIASGLDINGTLLDHFRQTRVVSVRVRDVLLKEVLNKRVYLTLR